MKKYIYILLLLLPFLSFAMPETAGTIEGNQTICALTAPDEIVNETLATGCIGTGVEYLWVTTDNFITPIYSPANWQDASGQNDDENYQPPVLNNTTYFMRVARCVGETTYMSMSNIVIITATSSPSLSVLIFPTNVNFQESYVYAMLLSAGQTYEWKADNEIVGNSNFLQYTINDLSVNQISVTVTNMQGCEITYSQPLNISNPLPVELAYCRLDEKIDYDKKINHEAVISWGTQTETDNDRFEIYWSTSESDWKKVGEVYGKGTTIFSQDYEFRHTPRTQINYYRIKQIDYDGGSEWLSHIMAMIFLDMNYTVVDVSTGAIIAEVDDFTSLPSNRNIAIVKRRQGKIPVGMQIHISEF